MALGQRENRTSQKDFQMKIVLAVMVVVFVWLVVEYTSLLYKKYQIDTKKQWFIEENDRISLTNRDLEKQYEYYKTDYFFRKEAKRKLNKKEPGEKVIVVTGGEAKMSYENDWDTSDDTLQAWWEYIFGISSKTPMSPADLYHKKFSSP
jgi:cell division protein FtsB